MTAVNTSLWQNNATLHNLNTQALNAYVNNGTSQWTTNETTALQTAGSHHERSCGIRVINSPNTTGGTGKSVRPPQRFTRSLTGGGHVHFIPNVELIRLYGASAPGGGDVDITPTGVIGIGIETLRLSSVADTTGFPNGNDAEIEIDIVIVDKNDTTKRAVLLNYPIHNTGLGTNWDPFTAQSVLWRGALGVSKFDRTYLFHNTQSNAWHFNNWSLTAMWNDVGNWIVEYRLHDPVSPYTLANSVSSAASINAGIYTYTAPAPFNEAVSASLMFSDDVEDEFGQAFNETISGELRFFDDVSDTMVNTWSESVGGYLTLQSGDVNAVLGYSDAVTGDIRLEASITDTFDGDPVHYEERVSGIIGFGLDLSTTWQNAPLEEGGDEESSGGGFVVWSRPLWRRLGLP